MERVFRSAVLLCLLFAVGMIGVGCKHPQVVVPHKSTAAEQYAWAVLNRETRNLPLVSDPDEFERTRWNIRQVLEKVPEFYPEDRESTPLALLDLAEMDAGLDHRRADVSKRDVRNAIGTFEKLREEYAEHNFVQIKTLYDIGLCYLKLNEPSRAQEYFLSVIEGWEHDPYETSQTLVKRSRFYYNRNYTEE